MSDFIVPFSTIAPWMLDAITRGNLWKRILTIGATLNVGNWDVEQIFFDWQRFSRTVPKSSEIKDKILTHHSLLPSVPMKECDAPVLWMIAEKFPEDIPSAETLKRIEAYVFLSAVCWEGQLDAPHTVRSACRMVRQFKEGKHQRLFMTFTPNMSFEHFLKILIENKAKYEGASDVTNPNNNLFTLVNAYNEQRAAYKGESDKVELKKELLFGFSPLEEGIDELIIDGEKAHPEALEKSNDQPNTEVLYKVNAKCASAND